VNIGRNHRGNDAIDISAWEIFGSLIEQTDFSNVAWCFPPARGAGGPHRGAEALATRGRHCSPRGAPPTEERWGSMRTRRSPPAPRI
jgi:hypothetical protein